MKKIVLFTFTAIAVNAASAQISIAPELGFQMTKVNGKTEGESNNSDMKAAFRAGVNADMGITNNIHISAGLFYSGMGGKQKISTPQGTGTYSLDGTMAVNYLQLPVYVNYMTGEAGGNRFFVGAGPYLGYAMSGNWKLNGQSEKIEFGSGDNAEMKRFDAGFNVNAGYMLSMGLYARAFYSMGLTNNYPKGNSDNSSKNMGFGLSIGYNLPF